ncbi:hypothetical protein EC950943_2009A, partial [Escherichia coli 95.0943]
MHPLIKFIIGIVWRDDDGFSFLHVGSLWLALPA